MTYLVWLLVFWGVLTTVLVVLLIYRSTLTMHEEDQLFLDEAEAHMEREQMELMHKVDRINPFVRWLGAASGVLIVVIACLAAYDGLTRPQ
jgi:Tfp pilus assembly protein PilN